MRPDLQLLKTLCGSPWGVMQNPQARTRNTEGLPLSVVVTRNRSNRSLGGAHSFEGVGASFDPELAYAKSILEAAERYCQIFGPDDENTIEGSYLDLKKKYKLINPESLNLYSTPAYQSSFSDVQPYRSDKVLKWSPLISAKTGEEHWLPSDFIYYNRDPKARLYIQSSNGTAIQTSLPRAIDSAALELIERDLFMVYWKKKIKPIQIFSEAVFSYIGVEDKVNCLDFFESIRFFWYPLPFPLYAVSCAIFGAPETGQPAFVLGGATHQDLGSALLKSLEEALQVYSLSRSFVGQGRILSPKDVIQFADHAFFYSDFENNLKHNSIFLKQSKKPLTVEAILRIVADGPSPREPIQDYMTSLQQELFYCDLTTRDIDQAGYKVVRTISPGFLGLDLNHNLRLDSIPAEKKYWTYQEGQFVLSHFSSEVINESPHPFA